MIYGLNEDVPDASFLSLYGLNDEKSEECDINTNIKFEAIFPSIKKNLFHQHMVNYFNKLEFNNQNFQSNGTVIDDNYKGGFFFFWSGFRDQIACSLLGGIIPIPEQRLSSH